MATTLALTVVSASGRPIYVAELASRGDGDADDARAEPHVRELVVRAALDFADARAWETNATYLRNVDRFNETDAHAYRCAGGCRFILLTSGRARTSASEEAIRQFFTDAHEAYAIAAMNPMRDEDEALGDGFDRAVRESARRRLATVFGL